MILKSESGKYEQSNYHNTNKLITHSDHTMILVNS